VGIDSYTPDPERENGNTRKQQLWDQSSNSTNYIQSDSDTLSRRCHLVWRLLTPVPLLLSLPVKQRCCNLIRVPISQHTLVRLSFLGTLNKWNIAWCWPTSSHAWYAIVRWDDERFGGKVEQLVVVRYQNSEGTWSYINSIFHFG